MSIENNQQEFIEIRCLHCCQFLGSISATDAGADFFCSARCKEKHKMAGGK